MALRPRRGMFELPEDVVPTAVKPAPTTKQTAPVGMPSSDPVKTQPGETGPFDPNAQAPVPAIAQASAPASSGMGINIDLDIPNLPSDIAETVSEEMFGQYGDRLFPYVYTARNDDLQTGQSRGPLDGISIEMLTAQELASRFAQDNYAQRAFGSFENYIGYLGDLLDLAEEHPEINWWKDKAFRNLTGSNQQVAEFYGLEDEDARMGSGARIDAESANLADANEAFEAMLALPEFRQLVADRGIETQFKLGENDIYVFNGLTATEIHEGNDTFGAYFEAAMDIANRLALAYMTGQVGDAGLSSLRNAAELGTLGPYSSSIGRVIDLMNSSQAGASIEASAILNEVGPLIVNLGDDTQIEDPLAEAEEEPAEESGAFDPLLTGDPGDLFEPDTTLEEDPFEFEVIEPEEQEEPEPDLPIEIEPPTLPEPEEDIFTDTVQEATGFEESVVRDLLDEYIQPVLASLEDQDEETAGIQTAIGTITEQQQETLQEFVRQGGQIEELDANQQQIIEDLGGVNQVVNNLAENVSGLEEGLQQAATEREDIRASQEAGFTQAEQDRQRLMEAIVEARGQTTELSQEMRDLLAQSNQTMQEMFEGTGVDIDELRSGQLSQEEATNALREYTQQEFGAVREELAAGLTEAQQERYELAQDLIEVGGLVENLDAASQERFDELDITVDSLAEEFGVDFDRLEQGLLSAEEATAALQTYAEEEFGVVREEIAGVESSLRDAIEAAQQGQTRELTEAEARLLSEITGVEAGVLQQLSTVEGGLNTRLNELGTDLGQVQTQLETSIAGVRGEVRDVEASLQDALTAQAEGQARQLTEAEARLLSQMTGVEAGVLRQLSAVEGALNTRLNNIGTDINQVQSDLESSIAGVRGEVRDVETSLQNALAAQAAGQARQLTEAEARLLAEITGGDAELLREMSAQTGGLQQQLNTLGVDITDVESRLGQQIVGLEARIDEATAQQLEELTGLRSEFLTTLSASEAAAIARNQGLSDQLTEQITGVRGETAAQIEGINERLTDRISSYEQQTGEQLDIAAEERAALGGQLGTLTTDVARVAEDVIRAGGRIEELDEASRQRYEELGLSIDELSLRVGVNLNALSEGMLTQDAALRELIEETTQQTEQSLTERLEEAEQGFATSLSDTEANLLSEITGVEAGVLQQLAEVEGGLQSQFGEQFDAVQQQVSGLGEQVTGLGEGITDLGQALGVGLLGLAAAQPTAQEIAAAMPRQPVKFDPFLQGLSPFQPLTPIALAPPKQTDAMSELNKFIGRQTGMLV